MNKDYVLWTSKIEPNACTLSELDGFKKIFALRQGVIQGDGFPADVTMRMDSRKPTDTLLTDNIRNLKNVVVVSSELRKFLLDRSIQETEFLPITVLDHKGRPADRQYFIMNPINNPDCLDIEACEPVWSKIDDTVIKKVKRLAIKSDWDGENRLIFRPKYYRGRPFVLASLADEITSSGYSGVRWEPIGEVSGRLK